ncbi:hypothetical protein E2P64_00190 [Candidatus Bathyarchaeota archaeon]|nr:hypothetical protein E2P64_00190 [Candidatus Bathyarchaeota archaeon]
MEKPYFTVINKPGAREHKDVFARGGRTFKVSEEDFIPEAIGKYCKGDGYSCIVSAGGDGTAGKVAWAAYKKMKSGGCEIPILPIPYGTGNDIPMATVGMENFDREEYVQKCVEALESGKFDKQYFDLIRFEADGKEFYDPLGIHLGLFQRATKTKRLKKIFGKNAYIIRGLMDVAGYRPKDIRIKLNGDVFYEGKIWAGQIANTPTTGGGKVYMEGVDPRDGELSFVYLPVENAKRRELPGLISDLTDMVNMPQVRTIRGVRTFEIESIDPGDCVDVAYCGENIGRVNHVYGEVIKGALPVLVPSEYST